MIRNARSNDCSGIAKSLQESLRKKAKTRREKNIFMDTFGLCLIIFVPLRGTFSRSNISRIS